MLISVRQVTNNGALAQKGFWNVTWPHLLLLGPVGVLDLWIQIILDTVLSV